MATVTEIKLLQKSRYLTVTFDDGLQVTLPCEYLRVHSPSAEVRGHHASEAKLVAGKKQVNITAIEPVGHYAVKLIFDDGHQTGLFTWDYLHQLGSNYESNWQHYLQKLEAAGLSRDRDLT